MEISDLQLGKAGEYLVCADLILKGFIAFPSEQGLSYDVVLNSMNSLIRMQVKTTRNYRSVPQRRDKIPSYLFNCRRCGKGGRKSYSDFDFDIMAFVCIKDNIIGYVPIFDVKQTMHFRIKSHVYGTKNICGRYLENYSINAALDQIARKRLENALPQKS